MEDRYENLVKDMIKSSTLFVLVDDQAGFRKLFSLTARLMNFRHYEMFETSDDMIAHLNGHSLEAFLIDWDLVGSVIIQEALIRLLKDRKPNIPVYIISTSDRPEEIKEAESYGAAGWIVKTDLLPVLTRWRREKDTSNGFKVWK